MPLSPTPVGRVSQNLRLNFSPPPPPSYSASYLQVLSIKPPQMKLLFLLFPPPPPRFGHEVVEVMTKSFFSGISIPIVNSIGFLRIGFNRLQVFEVERLEVGQSKRAEFLLGFIW